MNAALDDLHTALRDLVRDVVREELALRTTDVTPEYLSIDAAAQIASVAEGTIRRWIREERVAGYRAGRVLRVKRTDLDALLRVGVRARRPAAQLSPEELAARDFG